MNKNYYQIFCDQLNEVDKNDKKPTLLLHACCAPCSSHVLWVLAGHFDITVYFYNPNIDDKEEYEKRFAELRRFISEASFSVGVKAVDPGYGPEDFFRMAEGREKLPEGGARCYDCYSLRMRNSAEYARDHGFDYFTTTLSISPYKRSDWINEIGMSLEREMSEEGTSPVFLFSDFKKKNGYKHSIELSKEYSLYRQDYCGCRFSKEERQNRI